MLAGFLGHDITVHREYYRLPENTLQVAKVGKLLHCINSGNIAEYRGKSFDEIEINKEEQVQEEECSDSGESEDDALPTVQKPALDDALPTKMMPHNVRKKLKAVTVSKGQKGDLLPSKILDRKNASTSKKKRHCWSKEEKDAICRQFEENIKLKKIP